MAVSGNAVRPVSVPQAPTRAEPQGLIPFRDATQERTEIQTSDSGAISAGTQNLERTVNGSGYIYGLVVALEATAAGNAANVAYDEDGPWNALESVVLRDVNGEEVNVDGWSLYLANLINRDFAVDAVSASGDSSLYQAVTGSGATGGSFTIMLRVPVATNRRDLIGLLGNQDRAQQYELRTNIAPLSTIYSTPPTNAPTFVLQRFYESYAVPAAADANGRPQQQTPDAYGTIRFTTQSVNPNAPVGGSTVNHYVSRIGNTIRWQALVFRSNGSRATAHVNAPTNIRLKVGDEVLFNESYRYRRMRMFEQFGFNMPDGVLVYAFDQDFAAAAGYELGRDWLRTVQIQQMQYEVTYPAGFGNTNNSLTILTDDMTFKG